MSLGGPESFAGDHALCGVYYALVTQNDDTDPGARVKVKFPWLPESERDQSHWAPLAVPLAGKEYGVYWAPEVGDSVLVMFLAGDIRAPVVIGSRWTQEDPPPEENADGKNDVRLLKSRSGHRFIFDDSQNTKVMLSEKSDQNTVGCGPFAKSGGSKKNAREVPAPGGSEGVSLSSASGTLNVACPSGTLKITAMQVEVVATESGDVSGKQELSLESTGQAKVASTGKSSYSGTPTKIGP